MVLREPIRKTSLHLLTPSPNYDWLYGCIGSERRRWRIARKLIELGANVNALFERGAWIRLMNPKIICRGPNALEVGANPNIEARLTKRPLCAWQRGTSMSMT